MYLLLFSQVVKGTCFKKDGAYFPVCVKRIRKQEKQILNVYQPSSTIDQLSSIFPVILCASFNSHIENTTYCILTQILDSNYVPFNITVGIITVHVMDLSDV